MERLDALAEGLWVVVLAFLERLAGDIVDARIFRRVV